MSISSSNQYSRDSWYLIFTKPRSETKAQENLNRQGYHTYLPMVHEYRSFNGKNIKVAEAFFPRYLFIDLDPDDNWSPIRSTLGVSHLVRFGGIPAVVPDDLIASLKANEDKSTGLQQLVVDKFKPGDSVTVLSGPFAGFHGIYQQLKGPERVIVLLDIIGRSTKVIMDMRELQMR